MVALSGAEYRLLRVFLDHPQRVLNRDQLLNLTQGRDADLFDRSIDLLVSRLRQRLLDDAREPAYIKTVRSEGYVFSLPVEIVGAPLVSLSMHWPRTLASRLSLIFLIGLILAQALSFGAQYYERYESSKNTMLGNLETDVSTSIAILDRLPANERAGWLQQLQRANYGYLLSDGEKGTPMDMDMPEAPMAMASIKDAIGQDYPMTFTDIPGPKKHFQVHLKLSDGSPLTIDVRPSMVPLSPWLPIVLLGQLALMLACTWLAVRIAIRPRAVSPKPWTPSTPTPTRCCSTKKVRPKWHMRPRHSTPCRRASPPT